MAGDKFSGPSFYEIWNTCPDLDDEGKGIGYEFFLYSDVTPEFERNFRREFGPFLLSLSIVSGHYNHDRGRRSGPVLVLTYVEPKNIRRNINMDESDVSAFTGGGAAEEISALLSLEFGIRLRASEVIRQWFQGKEETCWYYLENVDNEINRMVHFNRLPILPNAVNRSPGEIELVAGLGTLEATDVTALVRSAKMYAESLWIAELEPHLAWLLLVSALETAAAHWFIEEGDESHAAKLSRAMPAAKPLLEAMDEETSEEWASLFSGIVGSARKFRKFWKNFFPERPYPEPQLGALPWSKNKMSPVLETIYRYRSEALHAGVPFPAPMCAPPNLFNRGNKGPPPEKCLVHGRAISMRQGVWLDEDVPITLNAFEAFTRGVLLNWWQSMLDKAS